MGIKRNYVMELCEVYGHMPGEWDIKRDELTVSPMRVTIKDGVGLFLIEEHSNTERNRITVQRMIGAGDVTHSFTISYVSPDLARNGEDQKLRSNNNNYTHTTNRRFATFVDNDGHHWVVYAGMEKHPSDPLLKNVYFTGCNLDTGEVGWYKKEAPVGGPMILSISSEEGTKDFRCAEIILPWHEITYRLRSSLEETPGVPFSRDNSQTSGWRDFWAGMSAVWRKDESVAVPSLRKPPVDMAFM